ncbi:hypothetical protein [Streptomyces sp. NPDC012466]|uniref:hypothetical protein n=1 Tax=Streptomyces sp. NPDC012466 TaxID=3364835 RepID=UPI0036EB40A4
MAGGQVAEAGGQWAGPSDLQRDLVAGGHRPVRHIVAAGRKGPRWERFWLR